MKRIHIFAFLSIVLLVGLLVSSSSDSYFFKVNKSFEIFGAVFRQISANYVEEIDPQELIDYGIDGILSKLDPYTSYYKASESEDIDLLTSGAYTGLGITVGIRDSMLTIISIRDGFPAKRYGLRIGDRLYKIDTNMILYKSTSDLRKYTRGKPGTLLDLSVIRDGLADTLGFSIPREQIKVKNVSYSGIIADNIGYIKLERFSRSSSSEVRSALNKLKYQDTIKGLVLDLRDNPGGLLEAAVSICEMFVPKGEVIVTTKGRRKNDGYVYRSYQDPIEPDIPIAILINENSASASEIVAGAIQDLDRGVIIGRSSYGKGLVQSVFDLPYKSNIKMTTAKYYTPSGRCIQNLNLVRNNFKKEKSREDNDTSIFYTLNGRIVKEYKGIMPDTSVLPDNYPDFINELINKNLFFNFANRYTSSLDSLNPDFVIDKALLKSFRQFTINNKFDFKSDISNLAEKLKVLADNDGISEKTMLKIDELQSLLRKEEDLLFVKYSKEISEVIEDEIRSRFLSEKENIGGKLVEDNVLNTAIDLLNSQHYNVILANEPLKGGEQSH